MAIHRSGPTPHYYEYICGYPLVPLSGAPSNKLSALITPGQALNWLEIPSFQRGISWDIQNVQELLASNSILLGNAILSQFTAVPGQFSNLPPGQSQYLVLVDGLQRLAVGTAFLRVLFDPVLAPTPNRAADAPHFAALAARVTPLAPFFFHNDNELLQHPRRAIADQYTVLKQAIAEYVTSQFVNGKAATLAKEVVPLFMAKQLALDVYFNFNRVDLLGTFIGINTVRVDLGPVDLLRSYILERATVAGWTQAQAEATENDFTATLTEDQKPKQDFLPFVNAAVKSIGANGAAGARLFPSWSGVLTLQDVAQFLGFIDGFEAALSTNSYLQEVAHCGALPVSVLLAYYYDAYLHGGGQKPSFFSGGSGENAELHAFLVCCYRLMLDGSVGRIGPVLQNIVEGNNALGLTKLADKLSNDFVGKTITQKLDQQWLEIHLDHVDQKRAPRIFNAMLLPARSNLGATFSPISFGRKASLFQVDHLIPDILTNSAQSGGSETQSLRNFAPLPTNQNRVAKATSCSAKLAPGGIYENYCYNPGTHAVHPYATWLVSTAPGFLPHYLDAHDLPPLSIPIRSRKSGVSRLIDLAVGG